MNQKPSQGNLGRNEAITSAKSWIQVSVLLLLASCTAVFAENKTENTKTEKNTKDEEREMRLENLEAELVRLRSEYMDRIDKLTKEMDLIKKDRATGYASSGTGIRPRFDVLTRWSIDKRGDPISQLGSQQEGVFFTRVRAFLDGQIAPGLDGGIQLSTGLNPNPTSPFIRFGDLGRSKSFSVAQAYLTYHPLKKDPGFAITFGKMPNPIWRGDRVGYHNSEMIWDDDVYPEGVSIQTPISMPRKLRKNLKLNNSLSFFVINNPGEELFTGLNTDTTLLVDQLTIHTKPVKFGIGFYDYQGLNSGAKVQNFGPFGPAAGAFGPSLDVTAPHNANLFAPGLQVTNNQVSLGDRAVGFANDRFTLLSLTGQYNLPKFFKRNQFYVLFDWVENYRVTRDRKGWSIMAGSYATDAERVGAYNYWGAIRGVERDAALGTFADSDLGVGTGYRGYELGGSIRIQPKTNLQIVFYRWSRAVPVTRGVTRVYIDIARYF